MRKELREVKQTKAALRVGLHENFYFGWLTSIRDLQGPPDQRGHLLMSFHPDIFQAHLNDWQPWPLPSQFCSLVHKINNQHWDYFAN